MSKDGVTINELSKMANVTVRTIRFYTDEGILDEPAGRDRYARYTRRHYLQLNAARVLKGRFLPLRVIRDQMASINESELERLAGAVPPQIDIRFSESENAENDTSAQIATSQYQYVASTRLAQHTQAFVPASVDHNATAPNETGFEFLSSGVRQDTQKPAFLAAQRSLVLQGSPTPPVPVIGDVWHRIVISPNMELHVREDGMQEAGEIRRILASLRKR